MFMGKKKKSSTSTSFVSSDKLGRSSWNQRQNKQIILSLDVAISFLLHQSSDQSMFSGFVFHTVFSFSKE